MSAPSPADGTVSVHLVRALVLGAQSYGITLSDINERLGPTGDALCPELLADTDARAPALLVLRLWRELPGWCGDEARFALRLADRVAGVGLTAAWWIVQSSSTWREGLERALTYQRLLHDHNRSRLVYDAEGVRYIHQVGDGAFRAPSAALEFGMAMIVHLARRSTGVSVLPARVRFQHAPPRELELHHGIFGDAIEFRAAADELVFDTATLDLTHASPEPQLRELLESHAAALLAKLPNVPDTSGRVRQALTETLPIGRFDLPSVAARLGVSTRTLQRRLSAEGTSFDTLLDDVRQQLALRYLLDARLGVEETALLLGFSESRAFHRAFLRWTGVTPGAYRRRGG
jgi:AraC-like DNA-binding protein